MENFKLIFYYKNIKWKGLFNLIDCKPISEEEEDNEKSVLTYLSAVEGKMIQIIHAYGLVLANVIKKLN